MDKDYRLSPLRMTNELRSIDNELIIMHDDDYSPTIVKRNLTVGTPGIEFHPLELFDILIKDCDVSRYCIDGSVRIKTREDGYVIWQNNEFVYEPPF